MSITTEYFQILILKSNKILKKSVLLYKIIPDQNVDFIDTIKGTIVATLLIELIIGILSIYFSVVDYSNVYGPLAALVMLMFSIAVCSEAIFFGMYVIFECHMKRIIKKL